MTTQLQPDETLHVYYDGIRIFADGGSWLYPLFDLEDFLNRMRVDRSRLFAVDTVTGRAAAFLIQRLGIPALHSGVMSTLAQVTLDLAGVRYVADKYVERIDCQTEELLAEVTDLRAAYVILAERAKRAT